jgi:hypothetical protein
MTTELLKPNALTPVEVHVNIDEFENFIRKNGVGFCCEYFGHSKDSDFTKSLLDQLINGE